jgi:hypothetical protein
VTRLTYAEGYGVAPRVADPPQPVAVVGHHRKPHPVIGVPSGATITVAVDMVKAPAPLVPVIAKGGIAGTVLSIVC